MSSVFRQDVSDLIAAGIDHEERRQLDQAERLYAAAARLAPERWEASYRLARIELARGDAGHALERLRALAGSGAPTGELHYLLGRACKSTGDLFGAVAQFRLAIAAEPALAAARVSLGAILKSQGLLDEARSCFERAAADAPELAEAQLNLGNLLKDLGELRSAAEALRRGLALWPQSAEGWYWLGEVEEALGGAAAAEQSFRRVAQLRPGLAEPAHAQARRWRAEGETAREMVALQRTITIDPRRADAWAELGDLLREGERPRAIEAYRRALSLRADWPEVLNNLGVLCLEAGSRVEGLNYLRRAARVDADSPETINNLGLALVDHGDAKAARPALEEASARFSRHVGLRASLARACLESGDPSAALEAARAALRLDGEFVDARVSAARALQHLERWTEAEEELRDAASAFPQKQEIHSNLGDLLLLRGRFLEAEASLRRAAELAPDSADALSNHGVALYQCGRPREAVEAFECALALSPEHYQARLWRSMALLMQGELRRGLQEFEWRWRGFDQLQQAEFRFDAPRWAGEPLRGCTILLTGEQGLGDVLQFVRFAPLVAARGACVWLYVHPPLVRLLREVPGVERTFAIGDALPAFDFHCPLMSAPHHLGIDLEDLPGAMPYLRAARRDAERWRQRLAGAPGLRVGLVWSGDPRKQDRLANLTDARRSVALAQLAPLARVPGVRWISLQKGASAAQAASPPSGMVLEDWTAELNDFADTAALVANLGLVVTVDTSVAHLAGGLGKPVWMLSRFDGCWRWMLDRKDSPWYPGLRIFRQQTPLDWSDAIEELARELERHQSDEGAA